MTAALIMAGGHGERMRATGSSTPKPLVTIRGVSLLERNLLALVRSGFRDVTIAVPSHTPEIAQFVAGRCQAVAARFGCRVSVFEERQPLGNIGAAAEIESRGEDLLIVYADNLTLLDLSALVRHHHRSGAALTAAVHREPFQIPFGEVVVEDGMIVAYLEKPERRILVSSGLFVLSPNAISYIPRAQQTAVASLANRLLASGETIAAFPHDAAWIDVNDRAAVERAEQLLDDHAEAFGIQQPSPDLTVAGAQSPTLHRRS